MEKLVTNFSKLMIDLSGRNGLVDRFYGNLPYSAANQQLDIYAGKGQYATGTVNPLAKYGYLSPANATGITVVGGSTGILSATTVDEVNEFAFFWGYDGTMRRTSSLTASTIANNSLAVSSAIGDDLEWYTINGFRFLFFSYHTGSVGRIGVYNTTGVTSTNLNGTSMFLGYDTQTGNFTTGLTITGGSSGATGHLSIQADLGATGTLFLTGISGTFTDGETITDGSGGSAKTHISGGIFSSVDADFVNTVVSGAIDFGNNAIKMIVADNGFMYILDGSALHKFNGAITGSTGAAAFGTLTSNVLLFPPQYTLTDGIDLRGRLWISLFRSTRDIFTSPTNTGVYENYCGVYVWDRITTSSSSMEDFIPVPGVREIRAIVAFQGVPTIFTVSSTRYTQVRMWNGSTFKVVKELGPEAYPRFHDSISVEGDILKWLGNDGKMYAYGKVVPDTNNALYNIGDMTTFITTASTFSNAGAILLANSQESATGGLNTTPAAYYLGTHDTTTNEIFRWYSDAFSPNAVTQQALTGNFFTPAFFLPKLSNTHFLTIYYPPIGSGGSTTLMNLNVYFNQSTTAWNGSAIPFTQDDAQRGYKSIPVNAQSVNSVQLGITYPSSTGIVNIPTPSHAILEYEPTPKRY